jgi:hypothetical protein
VSVVDHIVVAAPTLESGVAFVREALGVAPEAGGEHARMGTHNLLLRLASDRYLEVIAIDPAAPAPARPRWFALDALGAWSAPALSAWVARTSDIEGTVAAASEALGMIEPMSRGALQWLITIPADGSLPLGGAAPCLIEWRSEGHPAARLRDQGLSLAGLEVRHAEPERVARVLRSLGFEGPVSVLPLPAGSPPRLVAHIDTPQGPRMLGWSGITDPGNPPGMR